MDSQETEFTIKSAFTGEPDVCKLVFHNYQKTQNTAVCIWCKAAEGWVPYCTASVNIPEVKLSPHEYAAKTYAENEGVNEKLEQLGFVKNTGRTVETDHRMFPIYQIIKS